MLNLSKTDPSWQENNRVGQFKTAMLTFEVASAGHAHAKQFVRRRRKYIFCLFAAEISEAEDFACEATESRSATLQIYSVTLGGYTPRYICFKDIFEQRHWP